MCAYWARLTPGRVGRGADVQQDERAAVGDHLHGQGRAVHARKTLEVQDGGGHAGAGVAGRDHGVRLTVTDEAHGHVDAGIALAAHGDGGLLPHAHGLRGLHEAHVRRQWLLDEGPHASLVADEDDLDVLVPARPVDGAAHDLLRRVIATHGVHGDARTLEMADLGAPAEGLDVHVLPGSTDATEGRAPQAPCSEGFFSRILTASRPPYQPQLGQA